MPYVVEKKKKKNEIHSRRKRLITKSGLWECCVTIRIITCMSIRFQLQLVSAARGTWFKNSNSAAIVEDSTSTITFLLFLLAFKRDARVADHPLCFSGWSLLCMDDSCCSSFWRWITLSWSTCNCILDRARVEEVGCSRLSGKYILSSISNVVAKSYSSVIYAFVKEGNMKIDDKLLQQASAQRIVACNWILTYKMQSCRQRSMGKDFQAFGKLQRAQAVLKKMIKIYEGGANNSSAKRRCQMHVCSILQ